MKSPEAKWPSNSCTLFNNDTGNTILSRGRSRPNGISCHPDSTPVIDKTQKKWHHIKAPDLTDVLLDKESNKVNSSSQGARNNQTQCDLHNQSGLEC